MTFGSDLAGFRLDKKVALLHEPYQLTVFPRHDICTEVYGGKVLLETITYTSAVAQKYYFDKTIFFTNIFS